MAAVFCILKFCILCSDEIIVIAPLGAIPVLGDFKAQTEANGIFVVFQNAPVNDGLEMLISTLGGLQKFTEENVLCVGEARKT